MEQKVVLISVDGLRPEAINACGHPFYRDLQATSTYTLHGGSIVPSVTLPCHTSIFYGVGAARHGITINQWVPQVRPIRSVVDAVHDAGGKTAMCYTWDFLREMASPGKVDHTYHYAKLRTFEGEMHSDREVTRMACGFVREHAPDLLFLYLSATDWSGHKYGWMSKEYLRAVDNAAACLDSVRAALDARYTLMAVTDHGGHDRTHGTTQEEDMRIPLFFQGPAFVPGEIQRNVNLLDIAPTIADVLGFPPEEDWDGKSLLS